MTHVRGKKAVNVNAPLLFEQIFKSGPFFRTAVLKKETPANMSGASLITIHQITLKHHTAYTKSHISYLLRHV